MRRNLFKTYLSNFTVHIDWNFIFNCWESCYREVNYVTLDYLDIKKQLLTSEDLLKLETLVLKKSWWDSIDVIAKYVGYISINNIKIKGEILDGASPIIYG